MTAAVLPPGATAAALTLTLLASFPADYTVAIGTGANAPTFSIAERTPTLVMAGSRVCLSTSTGACDQLLTLTVPSSTWTSSTTACDFAGTVTVVFTWTAGPNAGTATFTIQLATPQGGWPCNPPTPISPIAMSFVSQNSFNLISRLLPVDITTTFTGAQTMGVVTSASIVQVYATMVG